MNRLLAAKEVQLLHSQDLGGVEFHGNSMAPFLRDGDALVVEPAAWESIRVGDVVTYRLEARFPTCRVVDRTPGRLFLKADAWPQVFQVWPEDLLGRVTSRTRGEASLTAEDWRWRAATRGVLARRRLAEAGRAGRLRLRRLRARARRRWLRWRHGYAELPVAVQINVASVCNLRCRMCPYLNVHVDPAATKFMSDDTFARILPSLAVVERIHFSGSGEPLLNRNLLALIERARRRYPRKQMDLTTNAMLLNEDIAARLIDLRLSKVHVSIDGARAETVEAIRRRVDFARVVANLEGLDRIKRERGVAAPLLMINCSIGHGTYRELVEVVQLAKRVGAREVQLLEMMASTPEDLADDLFHNLRRDGGRQLKDAIKLAEREGIQIHLPTAARDACLYPTIPHVGEDGEVYPCCFLDYDGFPLAGEDGATRLQRLTFGNVAAGGFRAVWQSDAFRDFRAETARGEFSADCRSCYDARIRASDRVRDVLRG